MTTGDVPDLPKVLKRARKAAGFSNAKDFLAAVKASGRKAPSYSTYAQWESGEVTPRDETLDPIIEYHREKKTWPEEPTDSDLASAIRDLTRELREAREERTALAARVEEMDAILKGLVGPAIANGEEPSVPQGTGE
jgi:transcriptional regulator with XRE-family HTH domain